MRVPSFGRTLGLARLAVFLIAAEVLVSACHLIHDVGPDWGLRHSEPAFFDRKLGSVLIAAERPSGSRWPALSTTQTISSIDLRLSTGMTCPISLSSASCARA